VRSLSLATLAGLIVLGAALAPASARDGGAATVEAAVWRSVADPALLYLSTRAEGGRWRTGNEPLDMSASGEAGRFRRSNAVAVAVPLADGGEATVEVAVWRSLADPSLLYLGTRAEGGSWRRGSEPLDLSVAGPSGRFRRSAVVAVRVPLPFIAPRPDPRLMEACANGVAVSDPEANPGLVGDCALLLEAHDILVGDGAPLGWSAAVPLADWQGVTVDGETGRVVGLRLWDMGLTGSIPPALGQLTALTDLSLIGNQLTGAIPSSLAALTNLRFLLLSDNQLTGKIPPELSQLTKMEDLWLHGNRLTGVIPSSLAALTNLQSLLLSDNHLTGKIPPELSQLTALEDLWIGNNQLTGVIPSDLGALANLRRLTLAGNRLTGDIPPALGSLTHLRAIYLSRNQLTGPIPSVLGQLVALEDLWLDDNQLEGAIPPDMGALSNLRYLYLSQNRLTGLIPSSLASLPKMEGLWLNDNQLEGCIPAWRDGLHVQLHGNPGLRPCDGK